METGKTEKTDQPITPSPIAPSINDLKAAVYDRIGEIEKYHASISIVKKEIDDLNKQIGALYQPAGETK